MADDLPRQIRLSPLAESDLEDIWRYTAMEWSPQQADRYFDGIVGALESLLAMPRMAREYTEFDPPVRIHPAGAHLLIYRVEGDYLEVLRVLSGRQNWQILLESDD